MNKKTMMVIGVVGTIIGVLLLCVGIPKYAESKKMIKLGDELAFGSTHDRAWNEHLDESKIYLGAGIAAICIFGVFGLVGISLRSSQENKMTNENNTDKVVENTSTEHLSIVDNLKALKVAYDDGLITEDEYIKKKEDFLSRM